jgi:hypothetical protein
MLLNLLAIIILDLSLSWEKSMKQRDKSSFLFIDW